MFKFLELSDLEKVLLLKKHGTYLMKREKKQLRYSLFLYKDFFVEVKYSCRKNEMTITTFRDISKLTPYLDRIHIPNLLAEK